MQSIIEFDFDTRSFVREGETLIHWTGVEVQFGPLDDAEFRQSVFAFIDQYAASLTSEEAAFRRKCFHDSREAEKNRQDIIHWVKERTQVRTEGFLHYLYTVAPKNILHLWEQQQLAYSLWRDRERFFVHVDSHPEFDRFSIYRQSLNKSVNLIVYEDESCEGDV